MLAVQHRLPLALAARVRNCRRPFRPSPPQGAYRLPHDVRDRLTAALAPFKNRDAAFGLATFLARYHSNPDRVLEVFAIDRRALVGHADLDLTEARIRRAITTLEAVGFLDRALPAAGSRYKATPDGLHRRPIKYVFGAEYGSMFVLANKRARRTKGSDPAARRPISPRTSSSPSTSLLRPPETLLKSPKHSERSDTKVYLGDVVEESGIPAEPSQDSALERALQRLKEAIGKPSRG